MACIEHLARTSLGRALAVGKVLRPNTCEGCGEPARVQGHHHDYRKRLEVTWLCRKCHYGLHVLIRRGLLSLSESRAWILNQGKGTPMSLITDDDDVEQRVVRALRSLTQRQYTLKEIEELARGYCDDPASKARLDEILRLSLFIEWLRKREKESGR